MAKNNENNDRRATLSLTEALHLIPRYSGESDIYPFLNICESVLNSVESHNVPLILKLITSTKLNNGAYNAIRYKEIAFWPEFRRVLLDVFEMPSAAANLQTEFNSLKMNINESVVTYISRVEEVFQKLLNALTSNKII